MLRKRIIGVVPVRGGIAVQSVGFRRFLPLGRPEVAVEYLNSWGVDEILLLDIDPGRAARGPDLDMVRRVSRFCLTPLTVGGGISSLDHVRGLIRSGADKVALNTALMADSCLGTRIAETYGVQCLVAGVDHRAGEGGERLVWTDSGRVPAQEGPVECARRMEALGAGEILLHDIAADGARSGFDCETVRRVVQAVGVPVIACGGAGSPEHFLRLFESTGAAAACAGNYFHYTEHSVVLCKTFLRRHGVNVRLDTSADYSEARLGRDGRLRKRDEGDLDALRFRHLPEEVI